MSGPGWALPAAACAVLCAACALMAPANVETRSVVIDKLPPRVAHGASRSGTLLVLAPNVAPAYDTTRMAYSTKPSEIGYFAHLQWGGRPSQMIQPLLVGTLRAAGAFGSVESPPYTTGHVAYALRSELTELRQDFTAVPPVLRFALHVELDDEDHGRVLLARDIAAEEPMASATPEAGAAAANEAVARALGELARRVIAALG